MEIENLTLLSLIVKQDSFCARSWLLITWIYRNRIADMIFIFPTRLFLALESCAYPFVLMSFLLFFLSFPKGYADMEHAGQPTMYKAIEKGIQCDGDIALY